MKRFEVKTKKPIYRVFTLKKQILSEDKNNV